MKYMRNRLIVIYHHHSYCSLDQKLTNRCPYDISANEFAKQTKTPKPEKLRVTYIPTNRRMRIIRFEKLEHLS